jgi:hypothetical protein
MEPAIAFRVRAHDWPALEVRVNFGVFGNRQASPAEIDDLARALKNLAPVFDIVAEERHEFGDDVETSLHQVVIEIDEAGDELAIRVVEAAERWAKECFAARSSGLSDF